MAFPLFVLAMGIVAALGNTVPNIVLATAIINFPLYVRVARAETSLRREAGFVDAARVAGHRDMAVLLTAGGAEHHADHGGPDVADDGVRHPERGRASASSGWACGRPCRNGGSWWRRAPRFIVSGEWWVALFPGATLMLAVFCFNLLGDGLQRHRRPQETHMTRRT